MLGGCVAVVLTLNPAIWDTIAATGLLALAVAFFVFFAGAAGAGVVAADFGGGADGFGRFGLACAGLILQILLLALLFAIELARNVGQALSRSFRGASCRTGHRRRWSAGTRRLRQSRTLGRRSCGSRCAGGW